MTLSSSTQFSRNRFIRAVIPTVAAAVVLAFSPNIRGQCVLNETQRLTAPNGIPFADYGWSIAVDGPVMVIGAPFGDAVVTFNGTAYIYRFDSATTTWNLEASLIAPGSQAFDFDNFGWAVGVSGDSVVVGAPKARDSFGFTAGAVYVFQYNPAAATWDDGRMLLTDQFDAQSGDDLGAAVSISVDIVVAGAPLDNIGAPSDAGSIYVFDSEAVDQQSGAGAGVYEVLGLWVTVDGVTDTAGFAQIQISDFGGFNEYSVVFTDVSFGGGGHTLEYFLLPALRRFADGHQPRGLAYSRHESEYSSFRIRRRCSHFHIFESDRARAGHADHILVPFSFPPLTKENNTLTQNSPGRKMRKNPRTFRGDPVVSAILSLECYLCACITNNVFFPVH